MERDRKREDAGRAGMKKREREGWKERGESVQEKSTKKEFGNRIQYSHNNSPQDRGEKTEKTSPMKQLKKLLSRVKGVLITWKDIQKDHHHGGNRSTPTHITVK